MNRLIFAIASISINSMAFAATPVATCKYLTGSNLGDSFSIEYSQKGEALMEGVTLSFGVNDLVEFPRKIEGRLLANGDVFGVLDQTVYAEPPGDYGAIKVYFIRDDQIDGVYASVFYYSDGPSYAGFYQCK